MHTGSIVFLMISAFAFVPLFLAEIARRDSISTSEDFFLQRRTVKLFPMYATVYATWMSAFAYMGAITYFYEQGPVYMTTIGWDALFAVLFYAVGRRIWFYGKHYHYVTPTDFFDDIYQSRLLSSIVTGVNLAFTIMYIELQLVGGLLLIESATDGLIPWKVSGGIFFVVLVTYLWAGGLRAVAMTDVFYGTMIIATIFIAGFFLMSVAGGPGQVFSYLIQYDPDKVALVGPDRNERVLLWLSLFIVVPVGAFMGPQMWIRNYASSGERNFEALPFWLFLSSIVFIGTLLAGNAGLMLSPKHNRSMMLLENMLLTHASPILTTVIFLGITAAIFSTANSLIHALSAVCAVDIHKRYFRNNISDRGTLVVAKRCVVIISVISYVLLALASRNIMNVGFYAMGGTAQLIVPVLGALFWPKSSARAATAGIVTGITIFLAASVTFHVDVSLCAMAGLLCNGVVFVMVSAYFTENPLTSQKIKAYRESFRNRKI